MVILGFFSTAIGNAFAVLTDSEKRQRYDKYGDENPQRIYHNDHYDYSRGFEGMDSRLQNSPYYYA